jgi:hypothetical protein
MGIKRGTEHSPLGVSIAEKLFAPAVKDEVMTVFSDYNYRC